jgi:ribose 5-phosphate isomerase B
MHKRETRVITESAVRIAARKKTALFLHENSIITPAAKDLIKALNIPLVRKGFQDKPITSFPQDKSSAHLRSLKIVALGADHGGFSMKEKLKPFIRGLGYEIEDFGTHSEEAVDYPDFAEKVALSVSRGNSWRGVIIDGAGIGSSMAANKVTDIRAALCTDTTMANNARQHNNANILTLGSGIIGMSVAKQIVEIFLKTDFEGGRHESRVEKIMDIEKRSREIKFGY